MSKIWFFLVVSSIFALVLNTPENVLPSMLNTSANVINLCVEFCAIYAVWLGIIEILEKSGLADKIAKGLTGFIKKVFKTDNPQAIKYISISLSANMLGLGNVATPTAIKAMQALDYKEKKLSFPILMFTIFSTCSIQLLPTTIIALRTNAKSTNPSDIVLPSFIVSVISLLFACFLVFVYSKFKKNKKEKDNKIHCANKPQLTLKLKN
jgi:spore maturation protein A